MFKYKMSQERNTDYVRITTTVEENLYKKIKKEGYQFNELIKIGFEIKQKNAKTVEHVEESMEQVTEKLNKILEKLS